MRQFVTNAALQYCKSRLFATPRSFDLPMSKQLALSSAFSIFAMAAFALHAGASDGRDSAQRITGAPIEIEAPAMLQLTASPSLLSLSN
jgi:hypothetical protein